MDRLLYNLHQDCDQRWHIGGFTPDGQPVFEIDRSWEDRRDAQKALNRLLGLSFTSSQATAV
ncbi:hypothetical protein BXU08_03990 [Sphingomonas sp. LM7]|nr:hypothetical protein BXU08_03990 [Sphingomonas sp. LM7]